jgi:hypothetical protein
MAMFHSKIIYFHGELLGGVAMGGSGAPLLASWPLSGGLDAAICWEKKRKNRIGKKHDRHMINGYYMMGFLLFFQ